MTDKKLEEKAAEKTNEGAKAPEIRLVYPDKYSSCWAMGKLLQDGKQEEHFWDLEKKQNREKLQKRISEVNGPIQLKKHPVIDAYNIINQVVDEHNKQYENKPLKQDEK